jgi:hypothetical protein
LKPGVAQPLEVTNISEQHVTDTAVMASELEQLPDLVGLLKLASYPAWIRVSLVPTTWVSWTPQ